MSDEKTEEPTEAKKREAKQKGQVVKSQELVSAATLAISFAIILSLGGVIWQQTIEFFRLNLMTIGEVSDPLNILRKTVGGLVFILVVSLLPAMAGAAIAGIGMNLLTGGLNYSPQSIKPDPSKLNPMNTLKRWFSKKLLMDALKIIVKTWAMIWVVRKFVEEEYAQFITLHRGTLAHFTDRIDAIVALCWRLVAVQVVFGAVDYGIQYYEHRQQMKMSKQEVKEEYKKQEGDPMVKAQRRAKARQMIKSSGMNRLGEASVVITNPTHLAVALKFNMQMDAPIVISKGADNVAFEIRKRAKKLNIPIVEDKPLARALFPLELQQTIPPELFKTVAELLLSVRDAEDYL